MKLDRQQQAIDEILYLLRNKSLRSAPSASNEEEDFEFKKPETEEEWNALSEELEEKKDY